MILVISASAMICGRQSQVMASELLMNFYVENTALELE